MSSKSKGYVKGFWNHVHSGCITTDSIGEHRQICSAPTQAMYGVGKKKAGCLLDGREWNQWPQDLQVQEPVC